MLKFDYINDVHLDFWVPFDKNQLKLERKTKIFAIKMLPEQPAQSLLIGGDLGHYNKQNYWFLEELSKVYTNILLVIGNHDFYLITKNQEKKYQYNSFKRVQEMKELATLLPQVTYLEGNTVEIEGVTFGGTGMWYDFSYGQKHLDQSFEDVQTQWSWFSNDSRKIKGISTGKRYESEKEKLEKVIRQSDVILTHVGPTHEFSPYQQEELLFNSFYFFDGETYIQNYQSKIWCFGHVHIREQFHKNGWTFISHSLGYPDQLGFTPLKQIELD
ncbi:metallophosphoesterase [Virgibacillus halodenitrificans]|uniref:metallophosphoesterase n=1 Tax=Virgibacillus halodenitrificans TaxID=1482 RepID=UPI000EF49E16|nr:metallophosphoesterase [Virgibacillus halodenitrificans]